MVCIQSSVLGGVCTDSECILALRNLGWHNHSLLVLTLASFSRLRFGTCSRQDCLVACGLGWEELGQERPQPRSI
jgi:hypothetical protein